MTNIIRATLRDIRIYRNCTFVSLIFVAISVVLAFIDINNINLFFIVITVFVIFQYLWLYTANKYAYYKLEELGNQLKKKVKS